MRRNRETGAAFAADLVAAGLENADASQTTERAFETARRMAAEARSRRNATEARIAAEQARRDPGQDDLFA
jgi:hypothetical protein